MASPNQNQPPELAPDGGLPTTTCSRSFRAGDVVNHEPSGEDWILATDEENGRVQACGWPESMAEAKDCRLMEVAPDAQRLSMLNEWAKTGKDHEHERDSRTRAARRQLSSENVLVMATRGLKWKPEFKNKLTSPRGCHPRLVREIFL